MFPVKDFISPGRNQLTLLQLTDWSEKELALQILGCVESVEES